MAGVLYHVNAGDGLKLKGMHRKNSFFNTPKEAVSEAFALKERLDLKYDHEIEWDYDGKFTGSVRKVKILKGYLHGDRKTDPFYLQILKVEAKKEELSVVAPKKPKKFTSKDQKVENKVMKLLK
ncbi:hypothetical protein RZN22_08330 [Bacillaceae bacterium S4-13-58]